MMITRQGLIVLTLSLSFMGAVVSKAQVDNANANTGIDNPQESGGDRPSLGDDPNLAPAGGGTAGTTSELGATPANASATQGSINPGQIKGTNATCVDGTCTTHEGTAAVTPLVVKTGSRPATPANGGERSDSTGPAKTPKDKSTTPGSGSGRQ